MEVIAVIPKTEEQDKQYIVQATEGELDKVSGIAEVEHIADRIQVGHEIKVSEVYDKLDYFKKNKKKLETVEFQLRNTADSIKNLLPRE